MFSKTLLVGSCLAAAVSAQAVTAIISPAAPVPSGCVTTEATPFEIAVVNITAGSSKNKRSTNDTGDAIVITLTNGRLVDSEGRVGYIASNDQFQFDEGDPQAGAIYTAGFSVCPNGTLALGGSAIWWECLSGTFYNLYDASQGAQCKEIFIDTIPESSSASATTAAVSASSDGQVEATTTAVSLISTISDNQVQAPTTASATTISASVISTISDNQIQAPTSASAVTTVSATNATTISASIISTISDNQIQAPTSASAITTVAAYTGAGSVPTAAAQVLLAAAGIAAYML